jgi:hypothetical protein
MKNRKFLFSKEIALAFKFLEKERIESIIVENVTSIQIKTKSGKTFRIQSGQTFVGNGLQQLVLSCELIKEKETKKCAVKKKNI